MNKSFIAFEIAAAAAAVIPARAGRDAGQMYQQEQANQVAAQQRDQRSAPPAMATTKIVLPLDHGPHAQTTPWLNRQLLLRAEVADKGETGEGSMRK